VNTSVTEESVLLGWDGKITLQWDYQHGAVEVYSKNDTHLGEFDPMMEVKISRATQAEVLLAADHVDY
jgi:hypothetical protein